MENEEVAFKFDPQTFQVLKDLADDEGKTMAETLRDAIVLSRWFHDAQKNGRVLVERNGSIREVNPF